jgi:hypothetical protein
MTGIQNTVIANEVKQSSKTKWHLFKPSGLPRRLRLLIELLIKTTSHLTVSAQDANQVIA